MNLQTWVRVDEIRSRFKSNEPVLGDYDLDTSSIQEKQIRILIAKPDMIHRESKQCLLLRLVECT
jgi:DUF438 domain-containing protein